METMLYLVQSKLIDLVSAFLYAIVESDLTYMQSPDLTDLSKDIDHCMAWWLNFASKYDNTTHSGDCTNMPWSCDQCLIDEERDNAKQILNLEAFAEFLTDKEITKPKDMPNQIAYNIFFKQIIEGPESQSLVNLSEDQGWQYSDDPWQDKGLGSGFRSMLSARPWDWYKVHKSGSDLVIALESKSNVYAWSELNLPITEKTIRIISETEFIKLYNNHTETM